MVSSKKHDETERGRSSSRSSFSRSSSITTPGPSNAYYPYPYMSPAFQYSLSNPEHAYAFPPGTSSGSHLGSGPFPNVLALPRTGVDMTCAYPGISHTASRKVHTHVPSPFSVKFEAPRSPAPQLQSGTPSPCSILTGCPPPVHGLSQGRVDLPSLCIAGSSTTHRPAPATKRASNWETWGVYQPPLTLPSTSSRKSMIPPDGIPASATTWFAPSSLDPIQTKPIPDLLPHYGRGLPPVTPFIPLHRVHVDTCEEELEACKHTLMLQQTAVGAIPASRLAHCVACELTSNLWLCLTCGSLGCGRRQVLGGNGHALNHFEATSHPTSVKLGTITPEGGADIWCYKCNDLTLDPALAEHLSVFGIDVKTARKTDKSTAEIRAEMVLYSYPSQPAWVTWGPAPPVAASGCSRIAGTPPVVPSQVPQMGHFPGIPAPHIGYGSYPSTPVEPSAPYDPWGPGKHPRFWHTDGDLRFVVENTEYQLHSYLFSRATTPLFWLSLAGSKFDFDRFLSVLYPACVCFSISSFSYLCVSLMACACLQRLLHARMQDSGGMDLGPVPSGQVGHGGYPPARHHAAHALRWACRQDRARAPVRDRGVAQARVPGARHAQAEHHRRGGREARGGGACPTQGT
ncbi:hypothetical protein DFH08DRAFT_255496 [Mycena albidolilacea]|uniref:UBP-type domain-containing protein n=1 Tax=Mycena albidolilacea TaxID=1033008 RepID=A0AAD7ENI0_9AGAR|nr:hypothetical protein DFH08DRAFT_255496 [Mycena albidolilacea]